MSDIQEERTMGQSIIRWAVIYAISIPILFLLIGLVVRTTLVSFN